MKYLPRSRNTMHAGSEPPEVSMKSTRETCPARWSGEAGIALLIVLIAVSLFSILGLYVSLAATASLRTGDNHESLLRARAFALAGLNHARALLAGLRFDDLLQGPDGTFDASRAYLAQAGSQPFRYPIALDAARRLNLADPSAALAGIPDDGGLNAGRHPGGSGLVLIPKEGVAQFGAARAGGAPAVVGRYFVKVTDNNGEASERNGDPLDHPFIDGDRQILVRSMGVARLLDENTSAGIRKNSVVVFEAKFRRLQTFELEAAVVLQTSQVAPAGADVFAGALFTIQGGARNPAMATIDADAFDGAAPSRELLGRMLPAQGARVLGEGGERSVRDVTASISAHPDRSLLLDRNHVWSFLRDAVPGFADAVLDGNQSWPGAPPVLLGRYDPALPPGAPEQDPRVTLVRGDLRIEGDVQGAGLLVVCGKLTVAGRFNFHGIVMVAGAGEAEIGGAGRLTGGMYVAAITGAAGALSWGTARLTIRDSTRIEFDPSAVRMAVSLIPPLQVGFREIQGP
jgi:hypothetical protein